MATEIMRSSNSKSLVPMKQDTHWSDEPYFAPLPPGEGRKVTRRTAANRRRAACSTRDTPPGPTSPPRPKHAAAQEARDLGGVDAIVLRFAAVDRLHVQRVAKREGDLVIFAKIGEPIPGEHALAADDEARAIRRDGVAKGVGTGGQIGFEDGVAIVVEDVGEHASCVQIDTTVECVGMVVEAHG